MNIPSVALSNSARRTLQALAAAGDAVTAKGESDAVTAKGEPGESTLPASHFAGIYGQRGRHHPSAAMSKILGEVASNLRDFAETSVALLSLEDARSWYLLFVDAEEHVLAGFY
ncbi:MAG: hypothetical protein AB8H86_13760 [Polyangiales bacterium]